MTGFTSFLLEQGIETELPIGLNDALGLLEEVVPSFTHHGGGTRSVGGRQPRPVGFP